MHRKVSKSKVWGLSLTLVLIIASIVLITRTGASSSSSDLASSEDGIRSLFGINKDVIAEHLGSAIRNNEFPEEIELPLDGIPRKTKLEYALDEDSQAQMRKLLSQYRPDYGAFVAMDAKTGRILTMVSYTRGRSSPENLTLRATFPAASIFKIVTASAAIDLNKAAPETVVPFNGANHTLYKRNVNETKVNRWTRHMTMREAFARSVNVFFGKLGLFYVGHDNLKEYAERFLFNQQIRADVPVQIGYARFNSDDPWSVVTAASGFTRDNTMSPLHGALIAAAIANDGVMMEPYLVDTIENQAGDVLYQAEPQQASVVVDPASADELRELFRQTVRSGTSRKSFRQTVRRSLFDDIEFGGKTGSLTGTDPKGKNDWFVGYARYRDTRIAVAALTVNEKKWRVKSSMLANLFFARYFKDLKTQEIAENKAVGQ